MMTTISQWPSARSTTSITRNSTLLIIIVLTIFHILPLSTAKRTSTPSSYQIQLNPNLIKKSLLQIQNMLLPKMSELIRKQELSFNFTALNHKLQSLHPEYLSQFQSIFTVENMREFNDYQIGLYLFLLGKMYLYDILPEKIKYTGEDGHGVGYNTGDYSGHGLGDLNYRSQARYLLGYYYLQMSAEVYENGDAYYYLGVLQYMKMTPTPLIKSNIKKLIKLLKSSQKPVYNPHLTKIIDQFAHQELLNDEQQKQQLIEYLEDVAYDMETHHLHNTEHSLFLASVQGQNQAKISLAYMFKDGISTQKNCSSSIAYYLSVLKQTRVETFEFPSDYIDRKNFQKQLYSNRKANLKNYGEYDPSVLMQTSMFDEQTLQAYQDLAMKYMTGQDGIPVNETIAVLMFQKLRGSSKIARIMLGFMYMKGRGTAKDYKKAKELFQIDMQTSKVAYETLVVMKYYGMGYDSSYRSSALLTMKNQYQRYEQKHINSSGSFRPHQAQQASSNQQKKQDASKQKSQSAEQKQKQQQKQQQQRQKSTFQKYKKDREIFRTPMMKYLVGSLVVSDHIKGDKSIAINLIDQAAKQGNVLALLQLGMTFIDGSDASYDCERAAGYFMKQALSHVSVQQRIELAKIGIKNKKYMFSLIKYTQLMMVGYKNAFINALYLTEVYKRQLFEFGRLSWSVAEVKKNAVYQYLMKEQIVGKIEEHIYEYLGFNLQQYFNIKSVQYLTEVSLFNPEQQQQQQTHLGNSTNTDLMYPQDLQQYPDYLQLKITSIGIQKHQISILQFYQYKKNKDINILHKLANIGENSPHIYQARFLLGRYYHHTNITNTKEEVRHRRALEEYSRATKNKMLAQLIYIIQGGEFKDSQAIFSHFMWYATAIIVVGIWLYRKKNKRMEEIIQLEQKKLLEQEQKQRESSFKQMTHEEEQRQKQPRLISNMFRTDDRDGQRQRQTQRMTKTRQQPRQTQQKQGELYLAPKFSEQQEVNIRNHRNLFNISKMVDQKMRSMQMQRVESEKQKQKQKEKEKDKKIEENKLNVVTIDRDQPLIQQQQDLNQKRHTQ